MPRSSFQKQKLLYLYKFLLENTDSEHHVTIGDMIEYLGSQGINAERKSLYDDVEVLKAFGADIEKSDNSREYYLLSRRFDLPELKLLVDLVQSSKFLSSERSLQLIKKLETLCSKFDASALQAHVNVQNGVKNPSEYNVYYNVDTIYNAILNDEKIKFLYFKYDPSKKKVYRREGRSHEVSPVRLKWDDENYYLICLDCESGEIRHYRVDRMENISYTGEKRDPLSKQDEEKIKKYESGVFSMFGGDFEKVKLAFDNELAGVAIDRFGSDVILMNNGDGSFTVSCDIAVSGQFFGWLAGLGGKARIVSPDSTKKAYREYLEKCIESCGEDN